MKTVVLLLAAALFGFRVSPAHAAQYDALQWSLRAGNVAPAWATTQGRGVTVCDADTGVDVSNRDIAPALVGQINEIAFTNSATDDLGHGTETAGVIVGRGVLLSGVAPQASLLVAKVMDSSGSGTYDEINAGIIWCVSRGAKVINLSLGGTAQAWDGMAMTVKWACGLGVNFAVSAGNDGLLERLGPEYWSQDNPASIESPCLITAEAETPSGHLAVFSSFHENTRSVMAPGQNVAVDYPDNQVGISSGTSYASPFVAGQLVLLRSLGATASEAVDAILATCHSKPWWHRTIQGYGTVDVGASSQYYLRRHHASSP